MTFDFDRELQRLEGKLKALRSKEYIPDALLEIVARTAVIQLEARAAAQADPLPEPVAGQFPELATPEAHAQGAPLLPRDAFTYDRARTAATFGRLLAMMRAAGGSLGAAAEVVREAMEKGELAVDDACDAALRDDAAWFDAWALRLNDAPSLVRFLAMGSVVPSVEVLAQAVAAEQARRT
ncbi:formate dehydrogenase accessory protein FdhE, partial [Desulfovibrio oxamicus]|nr:formate dehydrogenase accessory protein FdhE [Nitratidesulfovibrio oxamicus]